MYLIRMRVFLIICIFSLFGCASATEVVGRNEPLELNGKWWSSAGVDERVGVLYAFDDCLTYDASTKMLFTGSWDDYIKKITFEFKSLKAKESELVLDIFKRFGKINLRNMRNEERYGGEFWRAHNDDVRKGFVEGYISCSKYLKLHESYPERIDAYVKKINDLYNADDRNGEDAPEYSGSAASAVDKVRNEMLK